jgi:hypothetical protein
MDELSFFDSDFFFSFVVLLFLAEFVTGVVQVIGAIIRTGIKLTKGEPLGHLKTYWIIVGIYFLILGILYGIYRYLLAAITELLFNATNPDNPDNYPSQNYDNTMDWIGYLGIAMAVWIFLAWGIAIWYNIKIVFNKKRKITETEHV